jgi:uncharacterized membrane protein YeaQ/YmgE (transglycosylase-associated protein family)
MFELIVWIIVGAIAGWVASLLTGTDKQYGLFSNIVIGMIGSLVGGALVILLSTGRLDLLNTSFNNFNLASILVSILGAVVLIVIVKALRR